MKKLPLKSEIAGNLRFSAKPEICTNYLILFFEINTRRDDPAFLFHFFTLELRNFEIKNW